MERSTVAPGRVDAMPGHKAPSPLERFGVWLEGFPDQPARKMLHRAPIALWRLGLGGIIGRPLVLLTTRGRRSGKPRRTALMPHWLGGRLYLWCPYGDRSQWYRNVRAYPLVTVQSAGGVQAARAVLIENETEAADVYHMLKDFDADLLRRYLESTGIANTSASVVASRRRWHVFRLDPMSDVTLPPQRADLIWVWPVAVGLVGLATLLLRRMRRSSGPLAKDKRQ